MVRSWIRFALRGLAVACSLPLLAISFVIAALGVVGVALIPRAHRPDPGNERNPQEQWAANEFRFERALESYEALIDEHAWRRK